MNEFIEVEATYASISRRGLIKGVGINDAPYIVSTRLDGKKVLCPFYSVWMNMLERCYGSRYQARCPTYRGCSVCTEWITFTNFKSWMEVRDWKGMQLDKDFLVIGNKVYSPDTCIFVTHSLNKLMNSRENARGDCSLGVTYNKALGKYVVQVNESRKRIFLGSFKSDREASIVYNTAKSCVIKVIAEQQEDSRLREALLRISAELLQ
jgi:hypothetical protein